MHAKLLQLCPILCNPMVCSPLGSSVHRILQARILGWVAISFSMGSSQPRHWTWVSSLDWEDPLEKVMATHSSILAWRILWTEEPGELQSLGLWRVRHDWVTMTHSVCKLNEWGDNIQPWCTPFPIWNQSVVLCPVLTDASWPAYRFLRRKVNSL